jgi:CBS domain-containing protein
MEVTAPLGSYLTPSFAHASVGDAMRPWVLSCDPATPLVTLAQRMAEQDATHAVVIDDRSGRPVGVLSTLDIAGILGWGRA